MARDFLTILRRAIDVARERITGGETARGDKIGAEDVNAAAGEHDPTKRDEMKRDTLEERIFLEYALSSVQEFCISQEVNCFLVERDKDSKGAQLLSELVDLRFVHIVKSRITVREMQGKLFSAYMLDVSQYTGARKRRELEMIEFWDSKALDRIRRPRYVLDPARLVNDIDTSNIELGT